ncbi:MULTISPECIES: acyl-CoA dehydrogenase [Dietzia]|uniref:Acyl-CoA dehydrogenase n=1 Tax=Dietzia cinnamea TaxID=321318 RepID=A0AAW5Q7D7_9ACTN|nr:MULTISPECIES: acyl-CoA dehydrogenase [Dietzia]PWD96898.1 acyl-CoA dehydrogenase [Dietzia maris]MBM7229276.1 acyl-CoA dehydrogenase [Dietzia cinnamea]MCT1638874.1 acyl-CoA dehydrogenase [Dietzia cinnamea]MCT1863439.1 acyl-CoA dehydrogenase [Dietzia cinnamea]MCT2030435.1 acyl-CoA dehydrogenase [Dietzia cinnamea]
MSIATTPDQTEIQSSIKAWAKSADPVATVRVQEEDPEAWKAVWPRLAELGLFGVAIAEEHGGAGAEIVDLACMLETAAAHMAPGPVLSTALTGVLVSRAGGAVAQALGETLAEGGLPVGVCLGIGTATLDGSGEVTGDPGIAYGGTPGGGLLLPVEIDGATRWALLEAGTAGVTVTPSTPYDISASIGRVRLEGVTIPADRILEGITTEHVHQLFVTLAAAEAAGVADYTLATAVDYAKIREQFGRTIGSFQSIKHLAADMLCRTEQVRAMAWDAAVAAEDLTSSDSELPVAAAVAGALAFDNAVRNSQDCIQILGGIGFTFEHEAHFYMRRASALRQIIGGSARWRRSLAELTLAGRRRHLDIDLSEIDGLDAKREEIRALVAKVAAVEGDERKQALADTGLFMPHLPEPWGLGAGPAEQLLIDSELESAGVTRHDITIGGWAVPTILQAAPEHADLLVPGTMAGKIRWCQLFSEPGAGSDLAALRTTAEKVDGGWKLNGQKVWTSLAREADWAMCLARTDSGAPKHKGITYFLVDMRSEGIRTRPLREITGEALFNEVYLEDLFVPDEFQIGTVNDGWKIARTTLANERVAMGGGSSLGDAAEEIIGLINAAGVSGDALVLDEFGKHVADGVVGNLLDLRTALRSLAGSGPGAESSVRKIVGVRHRQDIAEFGLELTGTGGVEFTEQGRKFLMVRCLSIAGGTEQVLLNVVGERILGLPRD